MDILRHLLVFVINLFCICTLNIVYLINWKVAKVKLIYFYPT